MMESYNARFNDLFSAARPTLAEFCQVIKEEIAWWEREYSGALKGTMNNRKERKEIHWPRVPSDFGKFCSDYQRKKDGAKRKSKRKRGD